MITSNLYRPILTVLALFSLLVLNLGCGGSENPSDPGAKDRGGKDQRSVLTMDDTTLLNSIGQWHNDILDLEMQYLSGLDSATLWDVGNTEPFSHDQIVLRIHAQASTNPEFTPQDLEIPDSRIWYTPIFGRGGEATPESSWRDFLDSVRLSYGMGPFYILIYDELANIFTTSMTPDVDFENYLRSRMLMPYTDDEKNYIRLLVSIARKSREYWDAHPLLAGHRYDAMGKRTALPAWAVADLVGGGFMGLKAIASDLWNSRPVDWGHAGGQALIGAGTGSLLRGVVKKFKLK